MKPYLLKAEVSLTFLLWERAFPDVGDPGGLGISILCDAEASSLTPEGGARPPEATANAAAPLSFSWNGSGYPKFKKE